jgi:outer membrane protein TolC
MNERNTLIVLVVLSLLAPLWSAPAAAQTTALTPEEAAAAALANNPDVAVSRLGVRAADASVVAEEHRYVPQWSSSAGYRFGSTPQLSPSGTRQISTDSLTTSTGLGYTLPTGTELSGSFEIGRTVRDSVVLGQLGAAWDASVQAQVRQPLLRGFGVDVGLSGLEIARAEREASQVALAGAQVAVVTDTLQAYWALWSAQRELEIRQAALVIARDQLAAGEVRLEAGAIAPAQLTSLRAGIARAEEALVGARATITSRTVALARLMGADPGEVLVAASAGPELGDRLARDEALRLAVARAPGLAQLEAELAALGVRAEVARNDALPDLDLIGSAQATGLGNSLGGALGDLGSLQGGLFYVGVEFTIPVWNDGRQAAADQAELAVSTARARYAAQRADLEARVVDLSASIDAQLERLALARVTAEYARADVDAQSALFDAGRATSLDVVDAIQALSEAELGVVSLQVEVMSQELELRELVTGVSPST